MPIAAPVTAATTGLSQPDSAFMKRNTGESSTSAGGALHEVLEVVARREDARLAGDQHGADGGVGVGGVERLGHLRCTSPA